MEKAKVDGFINSAKDCLFVIIGDNMILAYVNAQQSYILANDTELCCIRPNTKTTFNQQMYPVDMTIVPYDQIQYIVAYPTTKDDMEALLAGYTPLITDGPTVEEIKEKIYTSKAFKDAYHPKGMQNFGDDIPYRGASVVKGDFNPRTHVPEEDVK